MPVIAIINRKGGSGKSTLATHIAAYAANTGYSVMLGDIDKQQSSRTWLNVRALITNNSLPPIQTWAHAGSVSFRAPAGVKIVVLDTPGGLSGFELAKVVMGADAVLMPVNNSMFDMKSASDCIEEIKKLPKIASGACKLGVVAMRIDSRTTGAQELAAWAGRRGVDFVAHLRSARIYVNCIEQGLTIFDLPQDKVSFDLLQWRSILEWLSPYLKVSQLNPAVSALVAAKASEAMQMSSHGVMTTNHTLLNHTLSNPTLSDPTLTNPTAPTSVMFPSVAPIAPALPIQPVKKGLFSGLLIPEFLKKR